MRFKSLMLTSTSALACVVAVPMFAYANPSTAATPGPPTTVDDVTVIAHRGASAYAPEHTLEAYQLAIEQCADFIEPDVVSTSDGELVARHENEISDTTNVAEIPEFADRRKLKLIDRRPVRGWFTEDFTLAELKTLYARERLPDLRPASAEQDDQYRIPTLTEIADLAATSRTCDGEQVGITPEIKHPTYSASIGLPMEAATVEILEGAGFVGAESPAIIQSFETRNLRELSELTDIRLSQLIGCGGAPFDLVDSGDRRDYTDLVTAEGLAEIRSYADDVAFCKGVMFPTERDGSTGEATDVAELAHEAGLTVTAWTFRAENQFLPTQLRSSSDRAELGDMATEICDFLEAGANSIFVDHPDLGVEAVAQCLPANASPTAVPTATATNDPGPIEPSPSPTNPSPSPTNPSPNPTVSNPTASNPSGSADPSATESGPTDPSSPSNPGAGEQPTGPGPSRPSLADTGSAASVAAILAAAGLSAIGLGTVLGQRRRNR